MNSFFAHLVAFLGWMILTFILLYILIFMIKCVFEILGFSMKKVAIYVLTALGLYTLYKKFTEYREEKKNRETT